jgi:hypothetical protein
MKQIKKTYVDVPLAMVEGLINDLSLDLRDVQHSSPVSIKQPDGKYTVEVKIGPDDSTSQGAPAVSGSGRYA